MPTSSVGTDCTRAIWVWTRVIARCAKRASLLRRSAANAPSRLFTVAHGAPGRGGNDGAQGCVAVARRAGVEAADGLAVGARVRARRVLCAADGWAVGVWRSLWSRPGREGVDGGGR
eukprot:6190017-Pleurochrysis_carterae.AAC.1